ncbi:MAG: rhodanese-like domain-containing protein [Epsilonproteobacteria bacterium]|nr:rhodanese-like domain-containing protein [Campylobacterota bacterium]
MKILGKIVLAAFLAAALFGGSYNPLDGVKAQKQEALKYANKYVTVQQLKTWMKDGKKFNIVDVREASERYAGQIPCKRTLNIPRGVLYGAVKKGVLKPNNTYIMVCRTGHRALLAAAVLAKYYNFKNVYVLKGGIKAWIQDGNPVQNGLHLGNVKITLTK